jgi:hypothetical protein
MIIKAEEKKRREKSKMMIHLFELIVVTSLWKWLFVSERFFYQWLAGIQPGKKG